MHVQAQVASSTYLFRLRLHHHERARSGCISNVQVRGCILSHAQIGITDNDDDDDDDDDDDLSRLAKYNHACRFTLPAWD